MILRHGCLSNVILDKHPAKVYLVKCTPNSFQQQMISLHALHYNPVERVNRILKTMISQYMGQNHWWWNEHPPQFQFAYNTAGHRTQPIYLTCDSKLASQGSLYIENCPALFTAASKTPSRWYELQWSELFRSRKPTATCADAIGDRELGTRCKNGNIPFSIKLQSLMRNSHRDTSISWRYGELFPQWSSIYPMRMDVDIDTFMSKILKNAPSTAPDARWAGYKQRRTVT